MQISHPNLGSPNAMVSPGARLWVESTLSGVPMVAISGGIHIGSVSANVDSVYIQSGTMYVASGNVAITGSVETYGGAGGYAGSDVYQGTDPWNVTGSVYIKNEANEGVKSILYNSTGSEIDTHYDADGGAHLGVTTIQGILTSSGNTTTDNIVAGGSFVGSAEETFGINGIQVYHYADKDCTIYVDQSLDATNWDIVDSFDCLANNACTRTFTSVAPYFRGRLKNIGAGSTTAVRFAMGMTPIINPLPRALENDRLKTQTSIIDEVSEIKTKVTPFGKLKTVQPTRIIGTSFTGEIKDTNFWTEVVTGTGSVSQGGQVILNTGSTADSTALYQSVRRARHVAGTANEFKFTGRLITPATGSNVRRCGVYDDNNGFFFQVSGATFGIGTRKAGTDTIINSGSFNGDYGPSLPMGTSMGNFVIWWWERDVRFFVNGNQLHQLNATTESLVNTNTFPIRMENINLDGNTTDNQFEILVASTTRLNQLATNPTYKYIDTNATTVLKRGAGLLQRIIVNDNLGDITIYDNVEASGTIISLLDTSQGSEPAYTIEYDCPFSNGLTVLTEGNVTATVIYE